MKSSECVEKVKNALLSMQRYSWEQGVTAQAFLELGDEELTVLLAKDAVVRQTEDGRLAVMGNDKAVTDPVSNGEPVFYAYEATKDPLFKAAGDKMLNYLLHIAPKTDSGILCHLDTSKQVWVDSFYMAPPFLAYCGYFQEAVKQIEGFRNLLWNPEKKLYSHIWDEEKQRFESKDFWGVGNGWAAAGIIRVLRMLPIEKAQEREKLSEYLKEGIDGCLKWIREDGLFHNNLDDASTFVETNTSQMLAYSIYRGIKGGFLDKSYLQAANHMREAVYKKVDQYGLVNGVCGAPTFDYPGTAPEGQAFFLLMEAAYTDLKEMI